MIVSHKLGNFILTSLSSARGGGAGAREAGHLRRVRRQLAAPWAGARVARSARVVLASVRGRRARAARPDHGCGGGGPGSAGDHHLDLELWISF